MLLEKLFLRVLQSAEHRKMSTRLQGDGGFPANSLCEHIFLEKATPVGE